MATITTPSATRSIAVQPRQPIAMVADVSSDWYQRNQTSGGATGPWTLITSAVTTLVWETPSTVTRRLLYDRLQLAVVDTGAAAPSTSLTTGLFLNLCEGPPAVQWVTDRMRNEAFEEPPMSPWAGESDDPPLETPLAMPGANRDGMGTELLETTSGPSGPANLVTSFDRGLFVDMAGKLGCRVAFTNDVRGLGPFPAIASYHHGGLYFQHDFGKSRTLGLTRVLYEDAVNLDVAIVRGDGRRNTYRWNGASFDAAASLQNTLSKSGGIFTETTPSGRIYRYTSAGRLDRVVDRVGNPVYYSYDTNSRLQKIVGLNSTRLGLVPYLSYDGSGLLERLVLEDSTTPANNRVSYFQYDASRNLTRIIGPESCITYFGYNGAGTLLTSVTDPEGFVWQAAHDANDRCFQVVDALSKSTYFEYQPTTPIVLHRDRTAKVTYYLFNAFGSPDRVYNLGYLADYYTYDGEGQMTQARNRLNRSWYYTYDGRSNRIASTDPLGGRSYFAYDSQDLLRTYVDPIGRATYLAFDGTRNRTTWVDPTGRAAYYVYETTGLQRQKKDRRGGLTYFAYDARADFPAYFTYDALNRRTVAKDAYNATTTTVYDAVGNVIRTADQQSRTTYFGYDRANRTYFQSDPAGALTYHAYDASSNRIATHVQLGAAGTRRSTYYQYDPVNRTVKQIAADGGQTYHVFDLGGNQTRVLDPMGRATYMTYDVLNRQSTRKDVFGDTWTTQYDARSSVTRQIDPVGRTTYLGYDEAARLRSQSNALGEFSYYFYDARGQKTQLVNPRGYATYMRYDLLGRQTHTIDALGGVSYLGYDASGNRTLSVDELGQGTYYTYDRLNRQTHVKDQANGVTYVGYDNRSLAYMRWDADGRRTYYAYDPARRLVKQHYANPVAGETADAPIYYSYDQVSNLRIVDDRPNGLGISYYDYDLVDRLTKKVTLAGAVYYEYDLSGMKVAFKDAGLSKNYYVYDGAGRLEREVLDDARTAYFAHDLSGLRTRRVLPGNKVLAYYTYDVAGRVRQLDNVAPGFGSIAYFAYQRDANGNPTWVRHEGGENTYYQYDALDRLTLEERKNASATMYGFRYAYDAHGNRLNKSVFSSPTSELYYTYDVLNMVTRERVLAGDTTYYVYDLAQRMTSLRVTGSGQSAYFRHDQRNQAKQIAYAKASSPDVPCYFAYNGDGERVYVSDGAGATYWQHDGNKLVLERLSDGTAQRRYRRNKSVDGCAADMVEVVLPSGERVYQATDPCGTPRTAVDEVEGAPQGQYLEDTFGNSLINQNDLAGLSDVRARWRGPAVSRVSTVNMGAYLPFGGICYLPKPPSLTFPGWPSIGASRVLIAVMGPNCNKFILGCWRPPSCEAGDAILFTAAGASFDTLDGHVTPRGAFTTLFGEWEPYAPLTQTGAHASGGGFPLQCSYAFGVLFPIKDPGWTATEVPISGKCPECECQLIVQEDVHRATRLVGAASWTQTKAAFQYASTDGLSSGIRIKPYSGRAGYPAGGDSLPHALIYTDVPGSSWGLAQNRDTTPWLISRQDDQQEEIIEIAQRISLYDKSTGDNVKTVLVGLQLHFVWSLTGVTCGLWNGAAAPITDATLVPRAPGPFDPGVGRRNDAPSLSVFQSRPGPIKPQ
jgi:YD repeat-containing protein